VTLFSRFSTTIWQHWRSARYTQQTTMSRCELDKAYRAKS